MSDDPQKVEKQIIRKLSRFLDEKQVKPECPICGGSTWTLLDKAGAETVHMIKGLRSYDTYTLLCDNCAFLRSHLAYKIDAYAQSLDESDKELDIMNE